MDKSNKYDGKKLKKVLLITEYLNPPYDEGIKKTVYNLFLDLDRNYKLQVICRFGFTKENIHIVNTNPLFLSKEIKRIIKSFKPNSLIYLPFQSSTFASYLRLKIFSSYAKTKNIVFIALQPKPLKKWQGTVVKILKPKFALTPSPKLNKFWNEKGVDNQLVPLLTDLSIFKPLPKLTTKQLLRKKYNLPINAFIVSHMGHLNEGRNLKTLIPLQQDNIQIVIVASSSTPEDAKGQEFLKKELESHGIIILDYYIEQIEEIYQLSDIYIFPVFKENSSIGMPLSILEARACHIPVIMTDYGSVKSYLQDDYGAIIYSDPKEFIEKVQKVRDNINYDYSQTKVLKLNNLFFEIIHNRIDEL